MTVKCGGRFEVWLKILLAQLENAKLSKVIDEFDYKIVIFSRYKLLFATHRVSFESIFCETH